MRTVRILQNLGIGAAGVIGVVGVVVLGCTAAVVTPAPSASLRELEYELTAVLDSVLSGDVGGIWSNDLLAGLDPDRDVALVLGPTGIPQPTDQYLQAAYNLYLQPSGVYGGGVNDVYSLWTPEEGGSTVDGLAADAEYLKEALLPLLANGNHVTLFGYSQSTAAISMVLNELAAADPDNDYADQISFVLVGDSASPHGILANLYDSMPSWLQPILLQNAHAWGLDGAVMNLGPDNPDAVTITPDSPYDGAVYTLMSGGPFHPFPDGYAWWEPDSFSGMSWLSQLIGMFSTHLLYLGVTPEDVTDAMLQADVHGSVSYFDLDPDLNFLELLTRAGAAAGWLPQPIAEFLLELHL